MHRYHARQQVIDNNWKRRRAMLPHIKADEWHTIISGSARTTAAQDKK